MSENETYHAETSSSFELSAFFELSIRKMQLMGKNRIEGVRAEGENTCVKLDIVQ